MPKITRKQLKDVRTAYIYADGYTVLIHKHKYKGVEVKYATVHEAAFAVRRGAGRLVVHSREALAHLLCADWIGWQGPTLSNGSEKTKEAGIRVQTIYLSFLGAGETWITSCSDLLSSEFTAQEDSAVTTYAEDAQRGTWDVYPITEACPHVKA